MITELALLTKAIEESQRSVDLGGFPVGALLAQDGVVASVGLSNGKQEADPTSHAETTAIRMLSAKLHKRNLGEYTLYSSMAPCLMCYGAAFWAGITRIVYAVRKDQLSWQHFEGKYDLDAINSQSRRPIELVHFAEQEPIGLKVINKWERDHPVPARIDERGE
jgi:tRNA(Arg) A34 adenosine deaminase TadA